MLIEQGSSTTKRANISSNSGVKNIHSFKPITIQSKSGKKTFKPQNKKYNYKRNK